jgi:nitronate monooxygenase
MKTPKIIQGGMGVNISSPLLAKTVSMFSKINKETLGTISGVVLEKVMTRQLGQGGPNAQAIIRALKTFPFNDVAEEIISEYHEKPHKNTPAFTVNPSRLLINLTICANYAFVKIAKEGHNNPVSINYLEKIAMPHVYAIFGAMLADVDFITMGAGIPIQIPALINAYLENKPGTYKIPVIGGEDYEVSFDPKSFFCREIPSLKRPGFIPIISSNVLATVLMKKLPEGSIYGFVVEEPSAGGHNAPPRNKINYGEKDKVDYEEIAKLGLPFWIGGSRACPEKMKEAISLGASGIQAGSIFALARESGMDSVIRQEILKKGFQKTLKVKTDMKISPTGFPFKLVDLSESTSDESVHESRLRVCDLCVLVSLYKKIDGSIGYRCPSEPVENFIRKGGKVEDTENRGCICNGLITTAGLRFKDENYEPAVVTLGDDVEFLQHLMKNENDSYSATQAITYLFED